MPPGVRSITSIGQLCISPIQITFDYVGLGLSAPERVRFRYRLEGFDQNWGAPIGTRQVSYTNLPPAWYRFRVEAANPDGLWSRQVATFEFQGDPLFWQTWWFRLSLLVGCALILLALHYLRVTVLARQLTLGFDERVSERMRLARDLHDTLLQGFQGLMLSLQAVSDLLPEGKPKDQLEHSPSYVVANITWIMLWLKLLVPEPYGWLFASGPSAETPHNIKS